MATQAESDVQIRAIQPGDALTGLSLGDPAFLPLKTFVRRHAQVYERQNLSRTYGAFDVANGNKLLGYVTLVCGEVALQNGDDALVHGEDVQYSYLQYPAVKIARLAVDRRFRKKGIGEELVNLALGIAQEFICPNVGCRFVMVDAKAESVSFYTRRGFTTLDTHENRTRDEPVMFVDLSKLD